MLQNKILEEEEESGFLLLSQSEAAEGQTAGLPRRLHLAAALNQPGL